MALMICNKCGQSNSENAYLCIECSSSLKDSKVIGTPDSLKFNKVEKNRIRSHCNEKFSADESQCKYCETIYTKVRTYANLLLR